MDNENKHSKYKKYKHKYTQLKKELHGGAAKIPQYTNDLIITRIEKQTDEVRIAGYVNLNKKWSLYEGIITRSGRAPAGTGMQSNEGLITIKVDDSWYTVETILGKYHKGPIKEKPIDLSSTYFGFMPAAVYVVMIGAAVTNL